LHWNDQIMNVMSKPVSLGPLSGSLDYADHSRLTGWAVDEARAARPVMLDAMVDGITFSRVVAERSRDDVGPCSFEIHWPVKLDRASRHLVTLRRVEDGAMLRATPAVINPPHDFKPVARQLSVVVAALRGAAQPAPLDAAIAVLLQAIDILAPAGQGQTPPAYQGRRPLDRTGQDARAA
jgi:hypothetical protein